jgi:perosamine synthetase
VCVVPISLAKPDINEADIQAVLEVMRTDQLALGPKLSAFETLIADYVGVEHAVPLNSGTSALRLVI